MMDESKIIEVAATLRKLAAILDPSGQHTLPEAPRTNSGTISASSSSAGPWDPAHPGYQLGDGWQVMLRKYARDAGLADSNAYVKDRGLTPRWPDEKQEWEQ